MAYFTPTVLLVLVTMACAQSPATPTTATTPTATTPAATTPAATTPAATTPGTTTPTTRPSLLAAFANLFRLKVNAVQTAVNSGLQLVNRTVSQATSAGRGVLNSVVGLKTAGLQAAANMTRQGIGLAGSLAAPIPIVGQLVQMGVNAGKAGVTLMESIGHAGIGMIHAVGNAKLNFIDGVAHGVVGTTARPTSPTTRPTNATTTARPATTTTAAATAAATTAVTSTTASPANTTTPATNATSPAG